MFLDVSETIQWFSYFGLSSLVHDAENIHDEKCHRSRAVKFHRIVVVLPSTIIDETLELNDPHGCL